MSADFFRDFYNTVKKDSQRSRWLADSRTVLVIAGAERNWPLLPAPGMELRVLDTEIVSSSTKRLNYEKRTRRVRHMSSILELCRNVDR